MPLFLLIRHGENDYVKNGRMAGRMPGVHLNKKGATQAQALAEKLVGAPVKAVYSSPLERAIETAEPIARALNLEVIECPGLVETNIGEWEDKTIKSLRRLKIWKSVQRSPSLFHFPGGETFAEAQFRVCHAILSLSEQHDRKDILVCVSHGDPIKLAVAYFMGMALDNFQRLAVAPASITALQVGEWGGQLLTLNYDLSFALPKS